MDQKEALDILKMGCNVFLTGPPGSGKTFLLNKYVNYLRGRGKAVAITASTGIAATHINGVTLHSWSGLGIKERISDKEIRVLMSKGYLRKKIKPARVLIIDEVSMLKHNQFDAVDRICQYFKGSFAPFGGIQVVCSGDFFQLPPIERDGEAKFITESFAWKSMDIKVCYLEGQFRQKDEKLSALLDHIRGNRAYESKKILMDNKFSENQFPQDMIPTKLYTHNIDVDAINIFELNKIKGKEFAYYMESRGPKELVFSLKKSCLAPEKLLLKRGAHVMFLKNNFEKGYVNGTQGRIIDFDEEELPVVKTFSGRTIIAKPAEWTVEGNDESITQISQIPLRLAWAITVHKSQGMNLDAAEIDLSKCFLEGMGYVAISRLRTLAGLKLVGINDLAFYVNEKAVEMDKDFRQLSQEAIENLRKMSLSQKEKEQKNFLHSSA
ncbi:MAG: AAA ATPase [Parcubacteria group bacterium GW2011_GWC2_39_11]|nr:MAG: AAA ATPase [Parcubacteria group bacterium GW2011_GWA2_38_27]KKQ97582.1 MAG: AAA ATPase [Parcubacteria group bacterium GW2011_GWC2_39_11]